MEPNDGDHPSSFARLVTTGSSPSSFPNVPSNGLRLRPFLAAAISRDRSAPIQAEMHQTSPNDLPVLNQSDISNTIHNATADVGYEPDMASPVALPGVQSLMHGQSGYAPFDLSFGHNPAFQARQAQAAIATPNTYNYQMLQPEAATPVLSVPSQNVCGSAYAHQYPNAYVLANHHNYQTPSARNESPYGHAIAGVTQPNTMSQYAARIPIWQQSNHPQAEPTALSGIPIGNSVASNLLGRDMSLPHNGIMPPNRLANGQPIGYHPAQPQATNMPLSENLPIRTEPGHVANDGNAMQALGNGGSLREYQNESIDVDNEANNFSGGVNWKMQNKPIDLSIEPDEPGKMKKRKREKEIVLEQDQSPYRIPHAAKLRNSTTTSNQQGGNDGVTKTVFVDPLCQPRRGPTGPPMRPFSSPAPANSPIRRSPRHAKSKSRKVDIELTDSSKQAQVSDANVDVPLGGLGESTREVRAETSGFRSRSRSNSKRRRPNSETKVDSPPKESDGICRAEKRRNTTAVAKRRTKRDERKRKSRKQEPIKQTSMKPPTKASTREERTDEDSDEISEMMRKKKMPAIGSRLIPAQSHGDSPLSNTVGDASQSDDDSFGAVGNEISSDDDDDTSIKTPPQERRTRGKLSEAITISDSPEKRRTLRRPGSLGTAHTSPTARRPKTTGTSRGAASKSKAKDIAQDSDDEDFSDSSKGHANKTKNQSTRRRPRGSKTTKESNAPSSPVNLISPTPSRVPRNGTRRSPCTSKGMVSSQQKADDLVADSSDDDFTDKRVSARTRGKRKRRTPANDVTTSFYPEDWPSSLQRGAGSDERFNGVGKVDKSVQSADEDPESRFVSRSDEDSDVSAEFPSQEQGSQPIDLKVKIVSKRKKAGPKVYPEREFLKLSTDELSIIRVAFIKRYPSPPSNMQAQGRYEAAHGTAMTSGMIQRTWETQLKPWSKRWWDFYLDFNNKVREKKASKPRDKDPTLKESEVKSWVEEYYREHGDAKPNVTATATTTQASTNMESS